MGKRYGETPGSSFIYLPIKYIEGFFSFSIIFIGTNKCLRFVDFSHKVIIINVL